MTKLFSYLMLLSLFIKCNNRKEEFGQLNNNLALEEIIQIDSIPIYHLSMDKPGDTQYIPISNKYKTKLDCIESGNLVRLSKYIDTIQLINYSNTTKEEINDTSFKYFSNVRIYDTSKTKYYLAFSKPIFFENKYCYIEVDFQGISGRGFLYLLVYTNNKWKMILKRPTWIS